MYVTQSSDFLVEARNGEFAWTSLAFKNLTMLFLGFVCSFVFVFFLNTVQPKENLSASQILPVGCRSVISDVVQVRHFTGHDAKEKSDICVYSVNGSVRD